MNGWSDESSIQREKKVNEETLEARPNARFPFSGHKSKSRHRTELGVEASTKPIPFSTAFFLRWLRVLAIFLRRRVNNERSKLAAIRELRF